MQNSCEIKDYRNNFAPQAEKVKQIQKVLHIHHCKNRNLIRDQTLSSKRDQTHLKLSSETYFLQTFPWLLIHLLALHTGSLK